MFYHKCYRAKQVSGYWNKQYVKEEVLVLQAIAATESPENEVSACLETILYEYDFTRFNLTGLDKALVLMHYFQRYFIKTTVQ